MNKDLELFSRAYEMILNDSNDFKLYCLDRIVEDVLNSINNDDSGDQVNLILENRIGEIFGQFYSNLLDNVYSDDNKMKSYYQI